MGGICRSIWLNRNGGGDIFKPGKVWCLGGARAGGGVGRASHKFTLSYHQMATIPFRGLADRAKRSAERERERFPIVLERTVPSLASPRLFRSPRAEEERVVDNLARDNGNRCKSVVPILLREYVARSITNKVLDNWEACRHSPTDLSDLLSRFYLPRFIYLLRSDRDASIAILFNLPYLSASSLSNGSDDAVFKA